MAVHRRTTRGSTTVSLDDQIQPPRCGAAVRALIVAEG
jgi:hypothetical protein